MLQRDVGDFPERKRGELWIDLVRHLVVLAPSRTALLMTAL
jgi:hypothetical protein